MDLIRFSLAIGADVAVQRLKAAAAALPMGLVAHIDGQANCANKGLVVPADQILEIFRPDFAVRVWAADKRAGIDIPIRIHVYEQDGRTRVDCRRPSAIFRGYGNAALDDLGAELDVIFVTLLGALEGERLPD